MDDVKPAMRAVVPQDSSFLDKWNVANSNVVEVACQPLGHLLAAHNLTHIAFFSLDVEGAELEVLRTLDFSRVTVDVLVVEANARRDDVRRLLRGRGFSHVLTKYSNDWFVRKGLGWKKQRHPGPKSACYKFGNYFAEHRTVCRKDPGG